ncbi:MAG TPA: hypothetical protein VFW54_03675, partial [Propionibacteriaceae bacterium]|nr:hypothetical protein [Propionibacteriaceae bacterium]
MAILATATDAYIRLPGDLAAIATIVIIGARHVKHAGPTPANKTVRRASGSGEFSSGGPGQGDDQGG